MGDVLYIQTDKNRKITDPHVRLGDISDLTSNNPEVLQRCKVLRVLTLESGKYGRCGFGHETDRTDPEKRETGGSGSCR